MFKPFKGTCINGCTGRWIVVKKGFCGPCNEKQKHRPNRNERNDSDSSDVGRTTWMRSNLNKGLHKKHNKKELSALGEGEIDPEIQPLVRKKKKALQYRRKPSGELEVFKEMWEEAIEIAAPDCPRCRCCSERLGWEISVTFFSHLLAKGTYPSLRLVKRNIWIKCPKCHNEWEFGDRSQPKFVSALAERAILKLEYYVKNNRSDDVL